MSSQRTHGGAPHGPVESALAHARVAGPVVVALVLALVVGELALQVRAQIRYGQSIFNLVAGKPSYVYNEQLKLKTLRPSAVIKGDKAVIETNSLGLRGADFDPSNADGEMRMAILGASTVMGTFASRNTNTSSERLQALLREANHDQSLRVINAGIVGLTIEQQVELLRGWVLNWGVKTVLWYPGTNDIGCRAPSTSVREPPLRIPFPRMPQSILTSDLIVMNTSVLRKSHAPSNQSLVPSFDPDKLHRSIAEGIRIAREAKVNLIVVTSATNYRSSLPADELARRAATAVFFRPCYTPTELAATVDKFNNELRAVAAEQQVPVIDAAQLVPPDLALFGDANHFSDHGEGVFAALLAKELLDRKLLSGAPSP